MKIASLNRRLSRRLFSQDSVAGAHLEIRSG
jgi:hypothetical protein